MLTIDGSQGEGGGQILRTSLALALVTGKAFRIERIRANREKPGLLRQHLTAVNAAAEVGAANVEGASLGAGELTFVPPGAVRVAGGEFRFAVGTAGSALLVLQTVLPPLMLAARPSTIVIEGGTHNRQAPPFDFIARAFLPVINRMGAGVTAELERHGFYPAGGGCVRVSVIPAKKLARLELNERGAVNECRGRAVVANLDYHIAERELAVVREKLAWSDESLCIEQVREARSPGNHVSLEIESEHVCEVFTGIGARGVMAETVAAAACDEVSEYLASEAAVGEHLADQLLLPMALAGGGSFTTNNLSLHATTNIEVIKRFLDIEISVAQTANRRWQIDVG